MTPDFNKYNSKFCSAHTLNVLTLSVLSLVAEIPTLKGKLITIEKYLPKIQEGSWVTFEPIKARIVENIPFVRWKSYSAYGPGGYMTALYLDLPDSYTPALLNYLQN